MILFSNVSFAMFSKMTRLPKRLDAYFTYELLTSVAFDMTRKLTVLGKSLVAFFTAERLFTSVDSVVHF